MPPRLPPAFGGSNPSRCAGCHALLSIVSTTMLAGAYSVSTRLLWQSGGKTADAAYAWRTLLRYPPVVPVHIGVWSPSCGSAPPHPAPPLLPGSCPPTTSAHPVLPRLREG